MDSLGIETIRFGNFEVLHCIDTVLAKINERLNSTSVPLFAKEGEARKRGGVNSTSPSR